MTDTFHISLMIYIFFLEVQITDSTFPGVNKSLDGGGCQIAASARRRVSFKAPIVIVL